MAVTRYQPSPLTSCKVHQQIEAALWLVSIDVILSGRPSVWRVMLSWTAEGPCLSFLAFTVKEWNRRSVCDTEWVWQRPWALGAVAEKQRFIATTTRWAVLVNWAVKQLVEASGVLWSVPKSFLAFVDFVAMNSKWFLCLQYRSYSVVSRTVRSARHCRLLTAYTVSCFIARETNKRELWGKCAFILDYFFLFPRAKMAAICPPLYHSDSILWLSHRALLRLTSKRVACLTSTIGRFCTNRTALVSLHWKQKHLGAAHNHAKTGHQIYTGGH